MTSLDKYTGTWVRDIGPLWPFLLFYKNRIIYLFSDMIEEESPVPEVNQDTSTDIGWLKIGSSTDWNSSGKLMAANCITKILLPIL